MSKRARAAFGAIAFAAVLSPAGSWAATATTTSYDLMTRQTDIVTGGEYDGRLRLRVSPEGIVAGSFVTTEGRISQVSGGIEGSNIWIDLHAGSPGTAGVFSGTLVDGKLLATRTRGMHTWQLEGTAAAR